MGSRPEGFSYEQRGQQLVIFHRDRRAAVLRGAKATAFLAEVDLADGQELMARLTGNYRRGNERVARQHPRHRHR